MTHVRVEQKDEIDKFLEAKDRATLP
jgi:hypothetical protein